MCLPGLHSWFELHLNMSVFKGELQMRIDDSQDLSSFGISFNSICAIKLRSLLFDVCFIYMPPKNVRSASRLCLKYNRLECLLDY